MLPSLSNIGLPNDNGATLVVGDDDNPANCADAAVGPEPSARPDWAFSNPPSLVLDVFSSPTYSI